MKNHVLDKLWKHDQWFLKLGRLGLPRELWNIDYSLLDHSVGGSRVHVICGKIDGASESELAMMELEGLFHDVGKTDRRCHMYRWFDLLTAVQRERVRTHTAHSGMDILNLIAEPLPLVRGAEVDFVGRLYDPVFHHDRPWMIRDPKVQRRAIGFQLIDLGISRTEKRFKHKDPLPLDLSLKATQRTYRTNLIPAGFGYLQRIYDERFEVIEEAFHLAELGES